MKFKCAAISAGIWEAMTHSYVTHFVCVNSRCAAISAGTWEAMTVDPPGKRSYVCDMTHVHMFHDSCICEVTLVWGLCVGHDSSTNVP